MGKGYDWKITLKKIGVNAIYMLIVGAISVWQSNPYYLVLMPVLKGAENFIKHNWL